MMAQWQPLAVLSGWQIGVRDGSQGPFSDLRGDNLPRLGCSRLVRCHRDFCRDQVGIRILPEPGQQALGRVLEPGLKSGGGQADNPQYPQEGLDECAAGIAGMRVITAITITRLMDAVTSWIQSARKTRTVVCQVSSSA